MLDKFKEEEQTFLSTSPESSDFEELPPDVPHLVESLPPSLQEEQLLLADSILPASQEERPGITSHDFKSMEKTESGAAGTLAQEELCAPTRTPDEGGNHHRGDDHHRGAITVKGLTSQEELVLPPFKDERQIRIADNLDSGQEPPSLRGLLAEQLFTVHEPFNANGLDSGQEPPSPKEEQQGGTSRDIDIGDIDSATETESGAACMPATEEPCVLTLASDSSDYDFGYNFKISDMSTIMKDKGLRPALGG